MVQRYIIEGRDEMEVGPRRLDFEAERRIPGKR